MDGHSEKNPRNAKWRAGLMMKIIHCAPETDEWNSDISPRSVKNIMIKKNALSWLIMNTTRQSDLVIGYCRKRINEGRTPNLEFGGTTLNYSRSLKRQSETTWYCG